VTSHTETKGKRPRGRPRSRWEQHVRRDATQKEGRTWKTEKQLQEGRTDEETLLLYNSHKNKNNEAR
jgi:hypothetical protein